MYNNDLIPAKQRTRENIKKIFLEMYKNKPLQKITVSDLISACDISRGTFYVHFANTCALYRECERNIIDFLEAGISDVNMSLVRMDYNKHIEVFSRFLKGYVEHIDMLKRFLNGSEKASFRQTWHDSICRNYEKSMEFSDVTSPSKRDKLILFYAGGQVALLSNWILADCKEPVGDIASISAQILFQGVFLQEDKKKTRSNRQK
jgi:AcrR family transcriptional regulator